MERSIDLPRGWQIITTPAVELNVACGAMAPMVTYETYVRERRSADLPEAPKRAGERSGARFLFPRWCTLGRAC